MLHRSHRSAPEREARSRLRQRLGEEPLLRGSLVQMARRCGKPGCHCRSGDKHVSLYLAIRAGSRRALIYLPPALEEQARRAVQNWQDVDGLLEIVSQATLERLLQEKQQRTAARPGRQRRRKAPSRRGGSRTKSP